MTAVDVFSGSAQWSVEQADAGAFLDSLPPHSIDLLFASPPYESARLYLENGQNLNIARDTEEWVAWMVELTKKALRATKGLVAWVVEGQTRDYSYSASPLLLAADLARAGVTLRKPPVYHRVGIPGSGGPDWLRNDYEFVVCATNGGKLPWSDNAVMGGTPRYGPGGAMSNRMKNGKRVNGKMTYEITSSDVYKDGKLLVKRGSYSPPEKANPGNVIYCDAGGGRISRSDLAHENEAPFPETLVEFFIRSFCPEGGIVCDPFSGSGTTLTVAQRHNRRFVGCDLRPSQVDLSKRRIIDELGMFSEST